MKKRRPSQNDGAGQNRVPFIISRTSPQPPNSRPRRPPRALQPAPPVVRPQLPDGARIRRVAPVAYPSTHAANGRYSYVGAGSNRSERT